MKARAGLVLAVGLLVLFAPDPAGATLTGPCQGTLNNVNVAERSSSDPGQAIKVKQDDQIVVTATSPTPIQSYKIELEYPIIGVRQTVAEGTANSTSWTRTVKVSDYTGYFVGLVRVHAVSNGTASCEGSVLVEIDGNPFTTLAGIAASALVLLAAANAIRTGINAARTVASGVVP